ncbi:hypothetical protein [Metabacillus sp. FJAT-53654]|uniref:Uncharacterized protein n=1 Tax=Metabacillus rhizosphaerae TaxID=3117747 RepID=A0ABZ2MQ43_9BACI
MIALTPSESTYLRNKLGRIHNVSVDSPVITLNEGASLNIDRVRVKAHYSDGTVAYKRFEANQKDLSTLNLSQPSTYQIKGKVVQHQFTYPMMKTRPDPYILL